MSVYLSALFLPGLMVVLFSKITFNRVIGLILSVSLIAASVYKGYTNTMTLIVIDAFSLTVGFWYVKWWNTRKEKEAKEY